MVIISTYVGDQKDFNQHWCPLMYKHQECQFYITAGPNLVYPKDLKNFHLNSGLHITGQKDGPILKCPIERIPTYRGMIELQKKPTSWIGRPEDLGEEVLFYDLDKTF